MLHRTAAYLGARFAEVDIPKPDVPNPDDVVNKTKDGGDWLAGQGQSFWIIVVVLVATAVVVKLLKSPFWRGIFAGLAILGIVGAIITK